MEIIGNVSNWILLFVVAMMTINNYGDCTKLKKQIAQMKDEIKNLKGD